MERLAEFHRKYIKDKIPKFSDVPENSIAWGFLALSIICAITFLVWFILHQQGLTSECNNMQQNSLNNILSSINPTANPVYDGPLKNFFVLTAFNCCSVGALQNDFVSTCALTSILKQGVRCLDMEVFSINNEPVVATNGPTSNTNLYTKETYNSVPFSSVMSLISQNAFSSTNVPNPSDPLILHLRFSSQNTAMYQNLANIFRQYDSLFLGTQYSFDNQGENFGDVLLSSLMNKISLIVMNTNSAFMDVPQFLEYVNMFSNGPNMRCLNYYDVINTPDLPELQLYNCANMSIVLPDQQSNVYNPNSSICQEAGCQMVAMQFQQPSDSNLQAYIQFFNQNGTAFALKTNCPELSISIPDAIPQNPLVSYETRDVSGSNYSFQI